MAPSSDYTARHLSVLEGLEAVRKRPGMYIGSTDSRGLMHCLWEIIDNSVDEALAGFGHDIKIILHADNSVEIHDDGRGVPAPHLGEEAAHPQAQRVRLPGPRGRRRPGPPASPARSIRSYHQVPRHTRRLPWPR